MSSVGSVSPLVVWLYCSDFKDSLYFYTEHLGFEAEIEQQEANACSATLTLEGQSIKLAFNQYKDVPYDLLSRKLGNGPPVGCHLCFQVESIEPLLQKVEGNVLIAAKDPWRMEFPEGSGTFYKSVDLLDPDGYHLTFSAKVS